MASKKKVVFGGIPDILGPSVKRKPFDIKAIEKSAKAISDSIDAQFPNLRPIHEFLWDNAWQEAGIEEKQGILFQAIFDIYRFLNKKKNAT